MSDSDNGELKNGSSFCLLLSCWTSVYENTLEIYWLIDLDLVSSQSDRGLGFGFVIERSNRDHKHMIIRRHT